MIKKIKSISIILITINYYNNLFTMENLQTDKSIQTYFNTATQNFKDINPDDKILIANKPIEFKNNGPFLIYNIFEHELLYYLKQYKNFPIYKQLQQLENQYYILNTKLDNKYNTLNKELENQYKQDKYVQVYSSQEESVHYNLMLNICNIKSPETILIFFNKFPYVLEKIFSNFIELIAKQNKIDYFYPANYEELDLTPVEIKNSNDSNKNFYKYHSFVYCNFLRKISIPFPKINKLLNMFVDYLKKKSLKNQFSIIISHLNSKAIIIKSIYADCKKSSDDYCNMRCKITDDFVIFQGDELPAIKNAIYDKIISNL